MEKSNYKIRTISHAQFEVEPTGMFEISHIYYIYPDIYYYMYFIYITTKTANPFPNSTSYHHKLLTLLTFKLFNGYYKFLLIHM